MGKGEVAPFLSMFLLQKSYNHPSTCKHMLIHLQAFKNMVANWGNCSWLAISPFVKMFTIHFKEIFHIFAKMFSKNFAVDILYVCKGWTICIWERINWFKDQISSLCCGCIIFLIVSDITQFIKTFCHGSPCNLSTTKKGPWEVGIICSVLVFQAFYTFWCTAADNIWEIVTKGKIARNEQFLLF